MTIDVLETQDTIVGAQAPAREWYEQMMADMLEPLLRQIARQAAMQLTPEQAAMIQAEDPEAFEQMSKFMGGA